MTDSRTMTLADLLHLVDRARRGTILAPELDDLHAGITVMAERLEAAEPPRQQAIHDALYEASVDGVLVFVDDATTAVMDVLQARRATAQRPAAATGSEQS